MDKCPKCGKKLSIFYIKQTCKNCGCDILYYDMDKRLEADAEQAEKEFEALGRLVNKTVGILEKIIPSFIRNKKSAVKGKEANDSKEKKLGIEY